MSGIAEIYNAHASKVYWSAYSITHNDSMALDIMQSVFLRALEHEETLLRLAPQQIKSWLYTTTRNACIDMIRKQKRELLTEDTPDTPDNTPLPEDFMITNELKDILYGAIEKLPEKYRQPVILYYFAQMQQNEIASYLGLNDATVRTRIKRAKAQLKLTLQEGGAS